MLSGLKHSFVETFQAVTPITLVVIILQVSLVSMPTVVFLRFLIGVLLVFDVLVFFLQGVKIGLLPMGELISEELPKRRSVTFMLLMAFVLGFVVTIAEPDVRVLAHQVDIVSQGQMNRSVLNVTVALGIAVFISLAMLRTILGIPIS